MCACVHFALWSVLLFYSTTRRFGHSRSQVDLDRQKRSEEYQIIFELALIEHAHLRRTFRASFVHRTMVTSRVTDN